MTPLAPRSMRRHLHSRPVPPHDRESKVARTHLFVNLLHESVVSLVPHGRRRTETAAQILLSFAAHYFRRVPGGRPPSAFARRRRTNSTRRGGVLCTGANSSAMRVLRRNVLEKLLLGYNKTGETHSHKHTLTLTQTERDTQTETDRDTHTERTKQKQKQK